MANKSLHSFRQEYLNSELNEQDLLEDPYLQFMEWMEDAIRSGISDPTAMALATADVDGRPSVRIVLLKEAIPEGFVFHTNYESRKGGELAENPHASIMFYWAGLERQLRIDGIVRKISDSMSDKLFNQRPADSRLSSIISKQSSVVDSREYLENEFAKQKGRHGDTEPKRPTYWGGYILKPAQYEFWQGRENRLHDRLQYYKDGESWKIRRLAP